MTWPWTSSLCGSQREESSCHQQTYKVVMKRSSPWALWTRCVSFHWASFSRRMVSSLFFLPHYLPSTLSSLLTAREEEKLRAQHDLGDLGAMEDASLSLNLMEPGCILQIQADRGSGLGTRQWEPGRQAGRGAAEHGQQARAAFGRTR